MDEDVGRRIRENAEKIIRRYGEREYTRFFTLGEVNNWWYSTIKAAKVDDQVLIRLAQELMDKVEALPFKVEEVFVTRGEVYLYVYTVTGKPRITVYPLIALLRRGLHAREFELVEKIVDRLQTIASI